MRNENFQNGQNNCMTITGLIASIAAFGILIWGVHDVEFRRKGVMTIYMMSFTFVILIMLGFIAILVLLNSKNNESLRTINYIGRFVSLFILFMCCIAFIFLLIAFIILIVDYNKLRKFLKSDKIYYKDILDFVWAFHMDDVFDSGEIADREWAALFVPSIIDLICLILMSLAAFISYRGFNEGPYPPVNVNVQNSTTNVNNATQIGMFPNVPK